MCAGFKGFGGDLRLPRSASGAGAGFRAASTPATQTQTANPFFDNIRQNAELAQGITERIPLDLPPSTVERADDLPKWLRGLVLASPNESADALAMQFYKVELGEQRRLQGIMDHHTRHPGDAVESSGSDSDSTRKAEGEMQVELTKGESAQTSVKSSTTGSSVGFSAGVNETTASNYFPYSITAGLEKGGKNRFKNIWPFDHGSSILPHPLPGTCH
jgi:tyrosine-protein phosphatase 2/3